MNKKYILALFLNIVPFFLGCLLYDGGLAIFIMFLMLQILVNELNHKWTNKVISYLFLNLAMLISSVASSKIITQLYYNNISSDNDTLAVGDFEVKFIFVFIILMTLISIIYRKCKQEIQKKNLKEWFGRH